MKHIGIVGCSAEGAALCFKTICTEGAARLGGHRHPQVSLHTHALQDYVECLDRGDLDGVAELMLDSAARLARSGADFLICPDNTIHQAYALVQARSPLPWLHIADVVAAQAKARGMQTLGITGTNWLTGSSVYPDALMRHGLVCVRPSDAERATLGRIIMDELVHGIFHDESVRIFQDVIAGLQARGCDGVILGCTEIPLIISDANSPLPTLDSTRLLARAALDEAIHG